MWTRKFKNGRGATMALGMSLSLMLAGAGQAAEQKADEISYTYVSLEYELSNIQQGSEGVTLGFSFEIAEPFHVFGGLQDTDIDLGGGATGDRQGYLIGGGVKQRIGDGMTAQFRLGYVNSKTDISVPALGAAFTDEGDGHYVEVGVRTLPWPKWELDGFVAHFSLGQYDNVMLFITLERRVTEDLGVNLSFKKTEGDNTSDSWIFALRYHL